MQKRNTQQRRMAILEHLAAHGEVQVDDLAEQFSTSQVTIRKDLAALEEAGELVRKFGGAVSTQKASDEHSVEKLSKRKLAIAYAAAKLLKDNNRIIIDSGSTTSALLPLLKARSGLLVMTNSMNVSNYLLSQENPPKLLMTGGSWDTQSHSFQGRMAEQVLRSYNFDQAFLGAAGLDLARGTTTYNELTQLSQVMAEVSAQVIVMAESSKLQHKIPNVELPWKSISVLVTDDEISAEAKQQIEQHGVAVICARPL